MKRFVARHVVTLTCVGWRAVHEEHANHGASGLVRDKTTIDVEALAGDVSCPGRRQENHHRCNVFRIIRALQRDVFGLPSCHFLDRHAFLLRADVQVGL